MKFIDPPVRKRSSRQHWIDMVQELKANPGRFGYVGTYSTGVGTHIRQGIYKAFYPDDEKDPIGYIASHWEIVTRRSKDGKHIDIYIKWIGEDLGR